MYYNNQQGRGIKGLILIYWDLVFQVEKSISICISRKLLTNLCVVLYFNDMLLTRNNKEIFKYVQDPLSSNFDMKYLGAAKKKE